MSRSMLMMILAVAPIALAAPPAANGPDRHVLADGLADADCVVLAPKDGSARVHLPGGVQEGAIAVVLVDGKIDLAGPWAFQPAAQGARYNGVDCAWVDTSGKTLTAGLIDPATHLGLVEVGAEAQTRDQDDEGASVGVDLRVSDAYNPRSTLIPIARVEGVTSAVVRPSGGRIAGLAAFVTLAGQTQAEAIDDEVVAVVASIGGSSRARSMAELRAVLEDARLYARNRAAFERRATRDYVASHRDLEALQPVVRGQVPLVVEADRAADIEALARLAKEQDIRLILEGGAEAWMHASALADAEIGVIVDPMVYGAGGFNQRYGRADNAKLLADAGVPVMLSTFSSHNARLLRTQAGNAVRGGMAYSDALRAITRTPARAFGQTNVGELSAGQVANVVVWSGDPLELRTSAQAVFIEGQAVPLDTRQWQLFRSYRELPGTPTPALSLPVE
ncbi:MAG: amidohydrolase family protein [Myxococcota bacterium]